MAKRRMGIMGFLIYICLCLLPCYAQAASTADAKEMISTERSCTLTVSYLYEETVFSDLSVKLYKIADVSANFQYTLTSHFLSSELVLNEVHSSAEWKVIHSTLEAHIIANDVSEDDTAVTDTDGQACFESLSPGLYLVVPEMADAMPCTFDSALVSLPGLGTDGLWQYELAVASKGAPPTGTGEETSYKILKLWKGEKNNSERPQKIEVEIFWNGESYQTVVLSEDNNWSYSWTAEADDTEWTVAERNVPSGYTATLEKRDTTFILTNTKNSTNYSSGTNSPKTGDTTNILFYMLMMYASGILLVLLGIIRKKKRV